MKSCRASLLGSEAGEPLRAEMSLEVCCWQWCCGALPRAPLSNKRTLPLAWRSHLPPSLESLLPLVRAAWPRGYARRGAAHSQRRTEARGPQPDSLASGTIALWCDLCPRLSRDQAMAGAYPRPRPCSAPSPAFPVSPPPYSFLPKRTLSTCDLPLNPSLWSVYREPYLHHSLN